MSEKPAKQLGPGLVTLEQAAALLMVSPEWIRRLTKEGYIEKTGRGAYLLVSVVQGYIRWLKEENRRSSKTAADSRLKDAKLEEIALRNAAAKRELIPMEDALAGIDYFLGRIRSLLAGLPASVTRDLDLREKVEGRVHEVLEKLAEGAREAGSALAAGRDPGAAEQEDDA